jgi:hypothetical protein
MTQSPMPPVSPPSSRADLLAHVDSYLSALGSGDPASFAFTVDGRFTENGQVLTLGEGLWASSVSVPGAPFLMAADEMTQQAAVVTVVSEAGKAAVLAARLAVRDGQVVELETVICREGAPIYAPAGFAEPDQGYTRELNPSERRSRHDLLEIVKPYFDALENDDASQLAVTDDFGRRENGFQTTSLPADQVPEGWSEDAAAMVSMSVSEQINKHLFAYVTKIRERRFPLVDETRGIVMAAVVFDMPGGEEGITLPDGSYVAFPRFAVAGASMPMLEFFRVTDGRIDMIDAVFATLPYGSPSGWES